MQARWGTHGDHPIIVLAAATTRDCFDLTVTAFNLSEKYRTPVILLTDEVVAHTREKVVLPEPKALEVVDRLRPTAPPEWYVPYADTASGVPPMGIFGDGYRYHVTGLTHDVHGIWGGTTPGEREEIRAANQITDVEPVTAAGWAALKPTRGRRRPSPARTTTAPPEPTTGRTDRLPIGA